MTTLSPEVSGQFGKLFVHVAPHIEDSAEKSRLHEKGVELLAARMREIETINFDLKRPVPELEVHANDRAPELFYKQGKPFISLNPESANAKADLAQLIADYIKQIKQSDAPDSAELLRTKNGKTIHDVDHGRKANPGYGFHGYRARYDLMENPDTTKHHRNTIDDIRHFANMRQGNEADKAQWQLWLDYLFDDKQLASFAPNVFLRHVRVLAGVGIKDVALALSLDNSYYSRYENNKRRGGQLPYICCKKILEDNIFHWPVDGNGQVEKRYAESFLGKMGHKTAEHLIRRNRQLASAVKAIAIEENRHPDSMPLQNTKDVTSYFLRYSDPDLRGFSEDNRYNHYHVFEDKMNVSGQSASARYAFILPRENRDNFFISTGDESGLRKEIANAMIFDTAAQAKSAGEFLLNYREQSKLTRAQVAKKLGLVQTGVYDIETTAGKKHKASLSKIIDTNAYDFPTAPDGKVHPEIIRALYDLNEHKQYKNPFVNIAAASKNLGITVFSEAVQTDEKGTTWVDRTLTPRHEAFKQYWAKLKEELLQTGKISINGNEVMGWIGPYGELMTHADQLDMLAKDQRWKKLQRQTSKAR